MFHVTISEMKHSVNTGESRIHWPASGKASRLKLETPPPSQAISNRDRRESMDQLR
jgi:hypothetical protein